MYNFLPLLFILMSAIITGCSTTTYQPPEYRDWQSKARNIMLAGEMDTGFSDSVLPEEEYNSLTSKIIEGSAVAYAGTGAAVTALNGLMNWQSAALNLFFWSMKPEEHASRNSIVAFMPKSLAKNPTEARNKLRRQISSAFVKVIEQNNGEIIDRQTQYDGRVETIVFKQEEWECSTNTENICVISLNIEKPTIGVSPSFSDEPSAPVYAFTSGDLVKYNYFNFRLYQSSKKKSAEGKTSNAPHDLILSQASQHMDKWVYMYVAPGKTYMGNDKPIKIPMVINKQNIEYFVLPKKS